MAVVMVVDRPFAHALPKATLPKGRPQSYYETHHRRLKAMKLAIVLLETGIRRAHRADNDRIRRTAAAVGINQPSDETCELTRHLIREGRRGQMG